ncbi:DUF423 domain-containing protein [Cyclobacterium sp. 1_MG-2023]|uniref:DUF423 domain-containing protein n=1 Tax=Cyclobacterium sp. 1_MG-2023 TaxID=3062681 RepID=UPI0026E2F54B|nr:DUF423 domain-containing protein [Cyclobacterium sp. 1_MG-2023]MDO6437547.1 DUF423 domain-containing protein [Cyclobacterium sp. 1_MG-2023]
MNSSNLIQTAAVFGALAVIFGAFGAHALEEMLVSTGRLDTYETAVSYHFYHSLALLMVGILSLQFPDKKRINYSALFFIAGILIFSGSLYILCLSQVTWLGAITPLGGLSFIIGWVMLLLSFGK